MPKTTPNISWLFYKEYYAELEDKLSSYKEIDFAARNKLIYQQRLSNHAADILNVDAAANTHIALRTQYPGLLSGTGLNHALGKNNSEIKLGFSFDHSSGLPYLPGSSVKGLIRSYFPGQLQKLAQDFKQKIDSGKLSTQEKERNKKVYQALHTKATSLENLWRAYLLPHLGVAQPDTLDLKLLEANIFVGIDPATQQPQSIYQRDIFFDAFPAHSFYQGREHKGDQGRFLGEGVITPHKYKGKSNPLKNPTPIKFLKILPEVSMHFQFNLHPVEIDGVTVSKDQKRRIFLNILQHFGIGAKTNVGFGKLEEEPGNTKN